LNVDLSSACNITSYRNLEWFRDIPAGESVLAGILFAIRDGIVLMHGYVEDGRSHFHPDLPERLMVEIGCEAPCLGFLHTALFQHNAFRWDNGEAIAGEYRIRFEDGEAVRLPVTVGGNIRDHGDPARGSLPFEQVALSADGRALLSACCWENPCPDRAIEDIEIASVEDTATSIALFAITALDEVPWDEKVFRSASEVQVGARTGRIMGWRERAADPLTAILKEKGLGPDALDGWPVNRSILKVESDGELFRAIDLDRSELSAVRKAVEQGETALAHSELADHLRSRQDWLRQVLDVETPGADHDTSDADALCENRFCLSGWTYDYGDREIDFYAVPTDLEPEPHFYFTHYLQYVGPSLYNAYAATRDERYVRRLCAYIEDVIAKCPIDDADGVRDNEYFLPAADADGDGWPDRPGQAQAWDVTTSANRLGFWIRGLALCMDSASVTDAFLIRFVKSAIEQIRHAYTQAPLMADARTNHVTFIAEKLIEWGICFPELRCAERWIAYGVWMLQRLYSPFWEGGMVYPDGSTTRIPHRRVRRWDGPWNQGAPADAGAGRAGRSGRAATDTRDDVRMAACHHHAAGVLLVDQHGLPRPLRVRRGAAGARSARADGQRRPALHRDGGRGG
jgi:hypothetical protein